MDITFTDVILVLAYASGLGVFGTLGSYFPLLKGPLKTLTSVVDDLSEVIEESPLSNKNIIKKLVKKGKKDAADTLTKKLTLKA